MANHTHTVVIDVMLKVHHVKQARYITTLYVERCVTINFYAYIHMRERECVCVCVRACERACVRACVRACGLSY